MTLIILRTSILLSAICLILVPFQHAAFAAEPEITGLACPGPSLAPRFKQVPDRENSPILLKTRYFDASETGVAEAREHVELDGLEHITTDVHVRMYAVILHGYNFIHFLFLIQFAGMLYGNAILMVALPVTGSMISTITQSSQ